MENMELQHHGIKGMRWGVRRYQNKDGTLTAKGKKRYAAEMEKLKKEEAILKNKQRTQAKIDRLLKKSQELEDLKKSLNEKTKSAQTNDTEEKADTSAAKSHKTTSINRLPNVKTLSDSDLKDILNRLDNEVKYKKYVKDFEKAQMSKGKKFIDMMLNELIIPTAVEVGKNAVKDITKDTLTNLTKKSTKKK